jgi:hypothetical protein
MAFLFAYSSNSGEPVYTKKNLCSELALDIL